MSPPFDSRALAQDKRLRLARHVTAVVVVLSVTLPVLPAIAGQFGRRFFLPPPTAVEYDSQFAFTRIRYGSRVGANCGWEHDYPTADRNFSGILDYITNMRVHVKDSNVLD